MKQLRGPKHENWPVRDPRAAPPGEYGLKSGENGHLARANGASDGPYCSPTWPSVFGRWCEPLAGRGGGFKVWGASSIRVPKKNARCPGPGALRPGAMRGASGLRPLFPGGGRRSKAVAFHNPQASSDVQEESRSCARGQVVVARPPVLTPPWRYRHSLVSKGRFTTSINVICVGIHSSLSKRRYRVVIDYVGDLLRHRGMAGCWLFRGL
jgi:hypothetical protein